MGKIGFLLLVSLMLNSCNSGIMCKSSIKRVEVRDIMLRYSEGVSKKVNTGDRYCLFFADIDGHKINRHRGRPSLDNTRNFDSLELNNQFFQFLTQISGNVKNEGIVKISKKWGGVLAKK